MPRAGIRKWTRESFIEKCKELHGDQYSYDKVEWRTIGHPIIVTCKVHGDVVRCAYTMLNTHRCQKCVMDERRANGMTALCHPDRPHHARNLCQECYRIKYFGWRATRNKGGSESKFFSHIKIRYGINREQYQELYDKCNGLCQICGKPPHENKRLHLDHCHKTGRLRGFLCPNCNWYMHKIENNPDILGTIKTYLNL